MVVQLLAQMLFVEVESLQAVDERETLEVLWSQGVLILFFLLFFSLLSCNFTLFCIIALSAFNVNVLRLCN